MQISTIQLLIPFSFNLNTVYCASGNENKFMYKYTIKDCSVALVAEKQMEVDIHIALIPKTQGKEKQNKKPTTKKYQFYEQSLPLVSIAQLSIYDQKVNKFQIINNNSSFIGGELELPEDEEHGLHLKYKYTDLGIITKIRAMNAENYQFEFELVYNGQQKNGESANFFMPFCEKYSDQGTKIVLKNKIYNSFQNTSQIGTLLKFNPNINQGKQVYDNLCHFDNHESDEKEGSTITTLAQLNGLISHPGQRNRGNSHASNEKNDLAAHGPRLPPHSTSSSDIDLGSNVPSRTEPDDSSHTEPDDSSHTEPDNSSHTEPDIYDSSTEYEYHEINFFTTVAGVSMLIQSTLGVILVILPAIYKLCCIYFSNRT